jgi:hypothetical protein
MDRLRRLLRWMFVVEDRPTYTTEPSPYQRSRCTHCVDGAGILYDGWGAWGLCPHCQKPENDDG